MPAARAVGRKPAALSEDNTFARSRLFESPIVMSIVRDKTFIRPLSS